MSCIVYVAIIQSNRLTPKIGITAGHLRRYVVAFSVNFDCAMLILHLSLKYSYVVFECCSDDMNVRGCLNYSGCPDGYRMMPCVIFFPCLLLCNISAICFLDPNSTTRLCLSIVIPLISFYWVPDTHTLATILLLTSYVWKITSFSYKTGLSLGPFIDCMKFMAIPEMFCDSISSFTEYFVAVNAILCGSHGCIGMSSMCGKYARSFFVIDFVLINIFVHSESKQAMNFSSGLMIIIGSVM